MSLALANLLEPSPYLRKHRANLDNRFKLRHGGKQARCLKVAPLVRPMVFRRCARENRNHSYSRL